MANKAPKPGRKTFPFIFKDGSVLWRDEAGLVHNTNGPAIIGLSEADDDWYKCGKRQRQRLTSKRKKA